MPRRNFILPAVALVGLILFFCFLVRLLLLRYERGDIYPEYSTLRADPLGTRAYFEALDSMSSYPVSRGFRSLHREMEENPAAIFYLGFDVEDLGTFTKEDVAELDAFVKNGGRVVMTFAPKEPGARDVDDVWKKIADKKKKSEAEPAKKNTPANNPPAKVDETPPEENNTGPQTEQEKFERDEFRREQEEETKDNPGKHDAPVEKYQRSLAAVWGFGWEIHTEDAPKKPDDNSYSAASKPVEDKPEVLAQHLYEGNVEPTVPWKSALYFVRLEPEWQRIYDAKTKPVFVRRKWGRGEIILATDSYFISNEALRNDRRPELLGLVTGPPGRILFDETHLGTEEKEGVMFLTEKFRLEGYLYGMLGVVLLFLWRNSVPLVPPRLSGPHHGVIGGAVSGKDSRSGLVNLLRRNIAAADILKTSFGEWRRNATPSRTHLHDKATEMQAVLSAADSSRADAIVQSYHQLREITTPRRAQGNYATKS
jgi:hypothetical protein